MPIRPEGILQSEGFLWKGVPWTFGADWKGVPKQEVSGRKNS